MSRRIAPLLPLLGAAALASAQAPILQATHSLDAALSATNTNFAPQGLGYDEKTGELLFVQQGTSKIYRTDETGTILGSVAIGGGPNLPGYYAVSVAADGGSYYFGDYFFNRNGLDVMKVAKAGGELTQVGNETASYLGTPLDVRGGKLFRTEPSPGTQNSYGNLAQVRVSSLTDPDAILQTLDLNTPTGIGDLTVDLAGNALYVLGYGNGDLYRYNLSDGSLLATYDLSLQSASAGLTFGDGKLYYYDWRAGSGSTLSVYSLQSVPEPATLVVLALGLPFLRRRKTSP